MASFEQVLKSGRSLNRIRLLHLQSRIYTDRSVIASWLEVEERRLDFVTSFGTYTKNLIHFLAFNEETEDSRSTTARGIAARVVDLTASVLVYNEFDLVDKALLAAFVTATLKYGMKYEPASLKTIVARLAEKTTILTELIATKEGTAQAEKLISVHFIQKIVPNTQQWGNTLVELINLCPGVPSDHGVSSQLERWRKLNSLLSSLERVNDNRMLDLEAERQRYQALKSQHARRLSSEEKKSGPTVRRMSQAQPMPENVTQLLQELSIESLTGNTADTNRLLEDVGNNLLSTLLRKLILTFPCRACVESAGDPGIKQRQASNCPPPDTSGTADEDPGETDVLFGEGIGIWKILLSGHAFKDIRQLSRSGHMDLLETRIRRLASGNWKGGNLSKLVPTQGLASPLLEANVGKQLRLLWQVDIAQFSDGIYRHIVKIWRVLDRPNVKKAVNHIVLMQKDRTREISRGTAFTQPIQDSAGIYVPAEFNIEVKEILSNNDAASLIPVTERAALEQYNKFYEFTQPVMEAFLSRNLVAEFPFDTSPEEMSVIKHNRSGTFIMGRSGTGKTTCLLYKLIAQYTVSKSIGEETRRQALITRSKHLVERLRAHTKRLVDSQLSKQSAEMRDIDVSRGLQLGEENIMHSKSFLDLNDESFPLVCTFEQLLRLIENTMESADRRDFQKYGSNDLELDYSRQYRRRPQIVDFSLFRSEYWETFSEHYTKRYEPGLVFSEFMGIIKGSAYSKESFECLTRKEYLQFSEKLAPTFLGRQREDIYDLFTCYEMRKREFKDRDGIDRVLTLLIFLQGNTEFRNRIEAFLEEIYVDEVQDQRFLDIVFILKLIKNPRGVHFAGDTAQCISRDSTFRFQKAKALFWDRFSALGSATGNKELAIPQMFKLNKNFRSHQGIISLASFVMKLLYTGFPQMVDKMDEETGQYSGPIPSMFLGFGVEVLLADEIVGATEEIDYSIDFGAEQVILVRDEATKRTVQERIGDTGLVLTILDSKGMEFDDVFLLDFFTGSPCSGAFRNLKDILSPGRHYDPTSNDAVLCSELKNLYVAVTRPRNQLWILESCAKIADPVARLLAEIDTSPLVEVFQTDTPGVFEKFRFFRQEKSGDTESYAKRGDELLEQRMFKEAHFCFKKANDTVGMKLSEAHINMEEGRKKRANGLYHEFNQCFSKAVAIFKETRQLENAVYCLKEMNKLEEAGDILLGIGQLGRAAELFMEAGCWKKASETFHKMGSYREAAEALKHGQQWPKLLKYLLRMHDHIEPSYSARVGKLCSILLVQGKISSDLQSSIGALLGNEEEKVDFFRKFKLTKQLAETLEKKGDFREAYEANLEDGNLRVAFELGSKHMDDGSGIPQAEVITLHHYIRYQQLLHAIHSIAIPRETSIPQYNISANALATHVSEWDKFSQLVLDSDFYVQVIFKGLEPGFYRDILAIMVVVYWKDLCLLENIESIRDLQYIILAVNRVIDIWHGLDSNGQKLPLQLSIVFGIWQARDASNDQYLGYSPLRETEKPQPWNAVEHCQNKLSTMLSYLWIEIDVLAKSLWKKSLTQLCRHFFDRGNCFYQTQLGSCRRKHHVPAVEEFRVQLSVLQMMCSLHCSFLAVYNRIDSKENPVVVGYLGRKRFWLENFLDEMTFRSSIEHDSTAIVETFNAMAQPGSEIAVIRTGLEDLLFHRLDTKEWRLRRDISSMFEQVQLSGALGPEVKNRIRIYLARKVGEDDEWNVFKRVPEAFRALDHIQSAVWHARHNNFKTFDPTLRKGLMALYDLPIQQFGNFHAILTIFESLLLYLSLCVSPMALIVPQSWIKWHLASVVSDHDNFIAALADRGTYEPLLMRVLEVLMDILLDVYNVRRGAFRYTFGKTKDERDRFVKAETMACGIQERSQNLVALTLVNLCASSHSPDLYNGTFVRAQKVFAPEQFQYLAYAGCGWSVLFHRVSNTFMSRYGGKDQLVFLTARGDGSPTNLPSSFQPLLAAARSQVLTLQSAQAGSLGSSGPTLAVNSSGRTVTMTLETAVTRIQAFWRRRYPYLLSHREAMDTPESKAHSFIIEEVMPRSPLGKILGQEKVRKAAILFTLGKDFLIKQSQTCECATNATHSHDKLLSESDSRVIEALITGPWGAQLASIQKKLAGFERDRDVVLPGMFNNDAEVSVDLMKGALEGMVAELTAIDKELGTVAADLGKMA